MDSTVLWVRWLVAGLSPSRLGFNPRAVLMRFVVDEVAMGQVVLPLLLVFPIIIIPPMLHTHFYVWIKLYNLSIVTQFGV
jgi:hypothetical protein